jgi:hypothetical protein
MNTENLDIIKEHCITNQSKSIHDKLYPLFYEKL